MIAMSILDVRDEYRPFRNLEAKNVVQERFEVPALVRLLRLPRGGSILEIGCGRGVALAPLSRLCVPSRLVGVDVDAEALADARRRAAASGVRVELVRADVRALPFDDDEFDVVVDFGTTYHVARADAALREISRVLRPGGVFVHELRPAQLLAHPVRAFGRALPWRAAPELRPSARRVFWGSDVKAAVAARGAPTPHRPRASAAT